MLVFLCILPFSSYSQITEKASQNLKDTVQRNSVLDSQNEDSISQNKDTIKTISKKKTFENRVNYSAKDSISIDMTDKRIYMYND